MRPSKGREAIAFLVRCNDAVGDSHYVGCLSYISVGNKDATRMVCCKSLTMGLALRKSTLSIYVASTLYG